MTFLLYDHRELEERTSNTLVTWKAFHTILFLLAAVCGILNYISLLNLNELVNDNCILFPRQLEFKWIQILQDNLTESNDTYPVLNNSEDETNTIHDDTKSEKQEEMKTRDVRSAELISEATNNNDSAIVNKNSTNRLILDVERSLFTRESACTFPEFMPLCATVFAIFWSAMFIICPSGGKTNNNFHVREPWRIVLPAFTFCLVLVALTGYSFTATNTGLNAFCAAFKNVTNDTECEAANNYLFSSWNSTWDLSERVQVTRAATAAVWACWVCACALLFARCLTAPDFIVKKTTVSLKDPAQKITPQIQKFHQRPSSGSPSDRRPSNARSEPTLSEFVTVSIENEIDSEPTSLLSSPAKVDFKEEAIEMTPRRRQSDDDSD